MCNEESIECRLASVPRVELPTDAQREIVRAILAVGPRQRTRWWSFRIPIWQAATACLLLCFATAYLLGTDRLDSRRREVTHPPVPSKGHTDWGDRSVFVSADPALMGIRRQPAYRTDIARWHMIEGQSKGDWNR